MKAVIRRSNIAMGALGRPRKHTRIELYGMESKMFASAVFPCSYETLKEGPETAKGTYDALKKLSQVDPNIGPNARCKPAHERKY